jgi:hypothetical protein
LFFLFSPEEKYEAIFIGIRYSGIRYSAVVRGWHK